MQNKMNPYQKIMITLVTIIMLTILISAILLIPKTLTMLSSTEAFITESQEALQNIDQTINQIDIDNLNQSIQVLSDTMQAIAKIFGR